MNADEVMRIVSEEIAKATRFFDTKQRIAREHGMDVEVRSISEVTGALSRLESAIMMRLVERKAS